MKDEPFSAELTWTQQNPCDSAPYMLTFLPEDLSQTQGKTPCWFLAD